jgi:hypothetical protein
MSAVAKPATVEQLVRSLDPHRVVIHHDFVQQPEFPIKAENAFFVPHPKHTGYGNWNFTQGVICLLKYCVEHVEFDYFQLMSPACLPIKPLSQFEQYIANSVVDAHAEFIDLSKERDAMVSFGHRCYVPNKTLRRSLLIRARRSYLGKNPRTEELAGVQLLRGPEHLWRHPLAFAGYAAAWIARMGLLGSYMPERGMKPMIGAVWIGATRKVCEYLVRRITEPAMSDHFRRFNDPGELGIPTLLGNSEFRFGPLNTFVNTYDGWHPCVVDVNAIDDLEGAPQFFARKFPDDPDAPSRRRALEGLTEKATLI